MASPPIFYMIKPRPQGARRRSLQGAERLRARAWTNSCTNESLEIALSANLLGKASCVQGWRTSATTGRQQANSSPQRASTPPRLLTIETRVRSPRNRLSRPCPRSAQCWHLLGWPASSRTNKAVRRIGKRWYSLPCHIRIVRIQGRRQEAAKAATLARMGFDSPAC